MPTIKTRVLAPTIDQPKRVKAREHDGRTELVTLYRHDVADAEEAAARMLAMALGYVACGVVAVSGPPVRGWRVWRVIC